MELILLLSVSYYHRYVVAAKFSELTDISPVMVRRFVNTTGNKAEVPKGIISRKGVVTTGDAGAELKSMNKYDYKLFSASLRLSGRIGFKSVI